MAILVMKTTDCVIAIDFYPITCIIELVEEKKIGGEYYDRMVGELSGACSFEK